MSDPVYCSKCGSPADREIVQDVEVIHCWICGQRDYPQYLRRMGKIVTCVRCGEEFEGAPHREYCDSCKQPAQVEESWSRKRRLSLKEFRNQTKKEVRL